MNFPSEGQHINFMVFFGCIWIEEEERKLEAAIEETEKQCAKVNAEMKELQLKSCRFKELEERYVYSHDTI